MDGVPAQPQRRVLRPDHQGEGPPPAADLLLGQDHPGQLRAEGGRRRAPQRGPGGHHRRRRAADQAGLLPVQRSSTRPTLEIDRADRGRQGGRHRRAHRLPRPRRPDRRASSGRSSIIVAARPSMGKTALCLNISQHVGLKTDKAVGFFSMEMSKEPIVIRMLCADAQIDIQRGPDRLHQRPRVREAPAERARRWRGPGSTSTRRRP